MEGPLRNADVDRLVLQYLRKRNFKEAEKVLELEMKEAAPTGEVIAQQWLGGRSGDGVEEGLLFATAGEGDPAGLVQAFDRFAAWVDNSLDLYKPELGRVLFPAFAHTYLNLVAMGAQAEAQTLMAEHRQRFMDPAAGGSSSRLQAMTDLAGISSQEAIAGSRTASALRSQRFAIRLCRASYELLAQHLQLPKQLVLLGVVNEHIKFEVHDGAPASLAELAEVEEDLTAGAMQADVVTINQRPLELQLLQGSVEDRYAQQKAEEAEEEANQKAQAEALTKKQRIALQKAAAEAKSKRENIGLDRMAPKFPLPPPLEGAEKHLMTELPKRVQLSAEALPSCAFFTFFNTAQSLNCVAFTSDASIVAGGFADSSVRLYDLQTRAADGGKGDWVTYFSGHSGPVYGLDFSPDNELLFSASDDGTVRLWSREVQANLSVYRGHMLPVWDVSACPYFAPYYFASCGADRTARMWSTDRTQPLRLFVGHTSDVDVVGWHPNCHYIASGSSDRTVRLWDVRTGECARLFVGHKERITSLAFSPDGTTLTTADASGTLIAWDLASSRRMATASEHRGPVWSLAYSQGEGSLLASGGADHTVRIWNAKPAAAAGAAGGAAAAAAAAAAAGKRPGSATGGAAAQQQQQQAGKGPSGGDAEGGAAAAAAAAGSSEPYGLLRTWKTKLTPVFGVRFTTTNLLLGSGALTLPQRPRASRK